MVERSLSLSSVPGKLNDMRFDNKDNFVVPVLDKKWRCAAALCKSVGWTMCKKYDVSLCIDCFYTFHKK